MNSKERVLTTISHNEPDRVPTSMNASPWVLYRLKKALGVSSDKELMARLNIDIFDMRGINSQGLVSEGCGGGDRFRMLQLVKQYLAEH